MSTSRIVAYKLQGVDIRPILRTLLRAAKCAHRRRGCDAWDMIPGWNIWEEDNYEEGTARTAAEICHDLIIEEFSDAVQHINQYSFEEEVFGWLFLREMILSGDIPPEALK